MLPWLGPNEDRTSLIRQKSSVLKFYRKKLLTAAMMLRGACTKHCPNRRKSCLLYISTRNFLSTMHICTGTIVHCPMPLGSKTDQKYHCYSSAASNVFIPYYFRKGVFPTYFRNKKLKIISDVRVRWVWRCCSFTRFRKTELDLKLSTCSPRGL